MPKQQPISDVSLKYSEAHQGLYFSIFSPVNKLNFLRKNCLAKLCQRSSRLGHNKILFRSEFMCFIEKEYCNWITVKPQSQFDKACPPTKVIIRKSRRNTFLTTNAVQGITTLLSPSPFHKTFTQF